MRLRLAIFLLILIYGCNPNSDEKSIMLSEHDGKDFGIDFSNNLIESEHFNILEYLYYYNGSGVGAGDFNNDGKVDLYFGGNEVSDQLYFNQGSMSFKNVSEKAGINDDGWTTGVSIVDINQDGWSDIYVCRLGDYKIYEDYNRLYLNNKDGSFTEAAAEYGLDFSGFSTQAAFFDFDQDGDEDVYLLNHSVKKAAQFSRASKTRYTIDSTAGDRFLINENGKFRDATEELGIYSSDVGFGLGIGVGDLNQDGWLDIYIANDFHEHDYLYLNQKGKGFKEVIKSSVQHSSNFSMGVTIDDLNQDGHMDILTMDMMPEDETLYKRAGGWESIEIYDFKRSYDYHHQSPRNALQVLTHIDSEGTPYYSERAATYGIHATDWSLSPIVSDFDGDGINDIFIANGIVRRPNDLDFTNYFSADESTKRDNDALIQKMPQGYVPNVLFKGKNGGFEKIESTWIPSASTSGVKTDLDNDGDLDIVVNSLNCTPSFYLNQYNPIEPVHLRLPATYPTGAVVTCYFKNGLKKSIHIQQSTAMMSSEYLDVLPLSMEKKNLQKVEILHQYKRAMIQKIKDTLQWPTNFVTLSPTIKSTLSVDSLSFFHTENKYNDQNTNYLQPYLMSTFGPKMVSDGSGLFVTSGRGENGAFVQAGQVSILEKRDILKRGIDENVVQFIDIDQDEDLDLYIGTGGYIFGENQPLLKDLIYLNENGKYIEQEDALPEIYRNTGAVLVVDYEGDGDDDLFIGVQGRTNHYGLSLPSYFLINDKGRFTVKEVDIEEMIYTGEVKDIDNDNDMDLVVAGHWMPITILRNEGSGKWSKEEIPHSSGLWNEITIADYDGDGDWDIGGGNIGLNHRYKANKSKPLGLIIKDFDGNNSVDPFLTYWYQGKEYIYPNLELFVKKLPSKRKDFSFVADYAGKTVDGLFTQKEMDGAIVKKIEELRSGIFFLEEREYVFSAFPTELQTSSTHCILPIDEKHFFIAGNFYEMDPNFGRQDAMPAKIWKYDGGWKPSTSLTLPPIYAPVRDAVLIHDSIYIGINQGPLLRVNLR